MLPELSIIIVNLNGGEMLANCIDSVISNTINLGLEIIVVDNGSTDKSIDSLAKYNETEKRIHITRNNKNMGFAKAVNKALDIASGNFICLLNNDAIVTKDSLSKLVQFLKENNEYSIAGPQLLNSDGSLQNSFDNIPTLPLILFNKALLRFIFPKLYPSKRQNPDKAIEVESVIGACLVIRKTTIERIGRLDEDYFVFLEETDWCLRARKAGYKICFLPSAKVYHLQGKTKETMLKKANVEYLKSLFTFFKKNRSALSYILLRISFPFKIFINMLSFFCISLLTMFTFKRIRTKFLVELYILVWLLLFCPNTMGIADE